MKKKDGLRLKIMNRIKKHQKQMILGLKKKIQKELRKNKLPVYKEFIENLGRNILSFDQ